MTEKALSNVDLQQLLNDYSDEIGKDRSKINIFTPDEMLKNPALFKKKLDKNHYCILFINPKNNAIGHWTSIFKNKKTGQVYFFDSYGRSPTHYDPKLTAFFKKHYPNIKYNTEQYQAMKGGINTCGRWAMLSSLGLNNIIDDFTPEKMRDIMAEFRKENKMANDDIVVKLIDFDLDE